MRQRSLAFKTADAADVVERQSAPQQKDDNNDHEYRAEASAIIMEGRPQIESAATKKKNQNHQ